MGTIPFGISSLLLYIIIYCIYLMFLKGYIYCYYKITVIFILYKKEMDLRFSLLMIVISRFEMNM